MATMTRSSRKPVRRRGISRIDQPSTRTHGWFVRSGFYERKDGTYAPRISKYFGDYTHGGKQKALKAAQTYLSKVTKS